MSEGRVYRDFEEYMDGRRFSEGVDALDALRLFLRGLITETEAMGRLGWPVDEIPAIELELSLRQIGSR